jgi:hypothetical protein
MKHEQCALTDREEALWALAVDDLLADDTNPLLQGAWRVLKWIGTALRESGRYYAPIPPPQPEE